jgi:hypothetical protein
MSITITVSEKTEAKIKRRAERTGQSVDKVLGDLVEEVWDERFPENGNNSTSASKPHPLFRMAGMFNSGVTDTSERMHEILYSEDLDPAQGFGTDK